LRVCADGAAMLEIFENFQAVLDDLVRFSVVDVRDEADATGIVLVTGVIEALRGGEPCHVPGRHSAGVVPLLRHHLHPSTWLAKNTGQETGRGASGLVSQSDEHTSPVPPGAFWL